MVNPQTQELLDKLYSEVLTRVYVNASGYRIMRSLAYGFDQRGAMQAHMPEVCYPAQGFILKGMNAGCLQPRSATFPCAACLPPWERARKTRSKEIRSARDLK